jgi:hypothetical protein
VAGDYLQLRIVSYFLLSYRVLSRESFFDGLQERHHGKTAHDHGDWGRVGNSSVAGLLNDRRKSVAGRNRSGLVASWSRYGRCRAGLESGRNRCRRCLRGWWCWRGLTGRGCWRSLGCRRSWRGVGGRRSGCGRLRLLRLWRRCGRLGLLRLWRRDRWLRSGKGRLRDHWNGFVDWWWRLCGHRNGWRCGFRRRHDKSWCCRYYDW